MQQATIEDETWESIQIDSSEKDRVLVILIFRGPKLTLSFQFPTTVAFEGIQGDQTKFYKKKT